MIDLEDIRKDLIRVSEKIGKRPSKKDYSGQGRFGVNTIVRRLGSWNEAMMQVFGGAYKTPQPSIMIPCAHCGSPRRVKPSLIREDNFCSSSCAASFNNRRHPKRRKEGTCKTCECSISSKATYCKRCWTQRVQFPNRTLGEVKRQGSHKSASIYAGIRHAARTKLKRDRPPICEVCGYEKHVEAIHKRPIGDFPDDTLVEEINDLRNLAWLCKNHHWEFDRGLISLP